MASEISISCSLSASKGGASINSVGTSGGATSTHDMAGADMGSETQTVTQAADVALDIPAGVSPVGDLWIKNLDATNYIQLSTATGGSFAAAVYAKVRPGRKALYQPTGTVYAKANTADCRIAFAVVEE
jgi:hypothetical protein